MSIELIVIIVVVVLAVLTAGVSTYLYLRERTLEEIREDVYQLFLEAEHTYLNTGEGKRKMSYVIQRARGLLPVWAQFIITDNLLEKVVEMWFRAVKDLLDDGKLNKSAESGE